MGSEVRRFKAELAHFLGVPADGVATVLSGTAALELARSPYWSHGVQRFVIAMFMWIVQSH